MRTPPLRSSGNFRSAAGNDWLTPIGAAVRGDRVGDERDQPPRLLEADAHGEGLGRRGEPRGRLAASVQTHAVLLGGDRHEIAALRLRHDRFAIGIGEKVVVGKAHRVPDHRAGVGKRGVELRRVGNAGEGQIGPALQPAPAGRIGKRAKRRPSGAGGDPDAIPA